MEKITLQLTVNEVNAILNGLSKLPYEAVHQIIANIQKQGQEQIKAIENATATKE